MAICQFCRKQIEEDKLMLHEMYCERNCIQCNRCGLMYDQNDPESHEEEFHKLQQCPHCKQEFQDLNKHQCQETPILCDYCQLNIPMKSFSSHEIQCGSRTEICDSCKSYVKKSDFYIHQGICPQKKLDKLGRGEKLDDFPSLQEVKQTNVSTKIDQQYKQKQEQQKQEQQKQNNQKFQTQQPNEFNNVPIKSQKIEYPNNLQSNMQDKGGDYNKDNQTSYKKEVNYSNYNNQINQVPDKNQINKQLYNDPKYTQGTTQNNKGLRSTQETQEFKQKSDRIQIHEFEQQQQQQGNRQGNNPKISIEEMNARNQKQQFQNYQQNSRPTQQINNTQEVISQNDFRSYSNSNNFKYPYNPPYDPQLPSFQSNYINSTQPQPPTKQYQKERTNQDIQEKRPQPSQDIYNNNNVDNRQVQGQKFSTNPTQNTNKNYQANKNQQDYGLPLSYNQNNKNTNQYYDDFKDYNPQAVQQRPKFGQNDRDQRQPNNNRVSEKYPVVSKPLDNQDRRQDKMQFAPQQPEQTNQFQYQRNPQAHQGAKYENPSQQKQQEYQQKQIDYQKNNYSHSQPKQYDYNQKQSSQQEFNKKYDNYPKQNEQKNYEYGKLIDNKKPEVNNTENIPKNLEANDSVFARQLQEQIYADDFQMTPQQIMEQKQLYKMLEENAKKQQSGQINTQKYYDDTREPNYNPQSTLSNGFEFLTEEEKQFQKQLLESVEQQKKR